MLSSSDEPTGDRGRQPWNGWSRLTQLDPIPNEWSYGVSILLVENFMRSYIVPTLSSIMQLGIFFAAAAALVVGMLGVR